MLSTDEYVDIHESGAQWMDPKTVSLEDYSQSSSAIDIARINN